MKAVRWLVFANPESAAETTVHFLPATPGAATPYPVEMAFTVYGRGVERSRLAIDGARLFHPDGVRIASLFPLESADPTNMVALEVDVYSSQTRSDVSASQCVIEFSNIERPLKFAPRKMIMQDEVQGNVTPPLTTPTPHLLMKDASVTPSIVIVNGTQSELRPGIYIKESKGGEVVKSIVPLGQVPPASVVERKLEGATFTNLYPQEMSWGLMKSLSVTTDYLPTDSISYYLIYRDTNTSKITSVQAI